MHALQPLKCCFSMVLLNFLSCWIMSEIYAPVTTWKITISELVTPDHSFEGRTVFNSFEFKTIKELKEYFLQHPGVARSLGYKLPRPAADKYNPRVVGRLGFQYQDRIVNVTKEFDTINDFLYFLDMHQPLAKCVEYVKKER